LAPEIKITKDDMGVLIVRTLVDGLLLDIFQLSEVQQAALREYFASKDADE
jgi:hypothetical protein